MPDSAHSSLCTIAQLLYNGMNSPTQTKGEGNQLHFLSEQLVTNPRTQGAKV